MEDDWEFPFCPQPPDWSLDWPSIVEAFTWVQAMKGCPQDPIWHAEGNVEVHTHMVCAALVSLDVWRQLPVSERSVLFAAALLHDVAKPAVTLSEDGRIRAPKHARLGARMSQDLLMRDLLPTKSLRDLELREQVVALVRHHGLPLYWLDRDDPQRETTTVSQRVRCDRLALLAEADVRGRICADQQDLLDRVQLFRDFCDEQSCLSEPRRFASAETRLRYFQGQAVAPEAILYDASRLEVTLLSGLPATGKDHWLRTSEPAQRIISLDAIRSQLRIPPEAPQGRVISAARQQAQEYLRAETDFIWNATNITRALRSQLIRWFSDYRARVRIVYVEAAWPTILERNRARPEPVPEAVLDRLARKLEVPTLMEAHQVEWAV